MSAVRAEGEGQLTLGKAVPRVDVAVVDIHDVHALVTHEVPFMPIALWGRHESCSHAGALAKARTPAHNPGNSPRAWAAQLALGGRGSLGC